VASAVVPLVLPGAPAALALVALALAAGAVAAAAAGPSTARTARVVDRSLVTHESVATALEWQERSPGDPFTALLARRASAALASHPPPAALPWSLARRVRSRLAALVVALPLAFAFLPRAQPEPAAVPVQDLVGAEEAARLSERLAAATGAAARRDLPRAGEAARAVSELLARMKERKIARRDALDRVSRLLERAERDAAGLGRGRLADRIARALESSRVAGEAARRARSGDLAGAARELEAMTRRMEQNMTASEERELERLSRRLADALRADVQPAGLDDPAAAAAAAAGTPAAAPALAGPADDPRAQARKERDVALYKLAEELSRMDRKKLAKLARAAREALEHAEAIRAEQLDREALERLIRAVKEGKMDLAQDGEKAGATRAVSISVAGLDADAGAGTRPGAGAPADKGTGAGTGADKGAGTGPGTGGPEDGGSQPGPGGTRPSGARGASPGPGTGGPEDGGGQRGPGGPRPSGARGQETITPFDRRAMSGAWAAHDAPRQTDVQGPVVPVKGRPGGTGGTHVTRVKVAPRPNLGAYRDVPELSVAARRAAEDVLEGGTIPREYRSMVRRYFDTLQAAGQPPPRPRGSPREANRQ
jgi:hypothetical protein